MRRLRKCPNGHAFRTIETLVQPRLTMYAIRQSGNGELLPKDFDTSIFRANLRDVLFGNKGPFDEKTLDAIAARALQRIEASIPDMNTRLVGAEQRRKVVGAIPDTAISGAVEAELKRGRDKPYRMAELLWVMAFRGRSDHRPGWTGARQVLEWIEGRWGAVESPPQQEAALENPLKLPAPRPTSWTPEKVSKRRGEPVDFSMDQFIRGIRLALWGREFRDEKALMIAHLVVGELRGQRVVTSSQLSTGVLAGLRRIDDIAYLRWATFVKNFTSVRRFAVEAADLVAYRSPPMRITAQWKGMAKAWRKRERARERARAEAAT